MQIILIWLYWSAQNFAGQAQKDKLFFLKLLFWNRKQELKSLIENIKHCYFSAL
jgi:hypothetical protein